MKSSVVKRSIVIAGHKTSVSLEDAFWKSLKEIADQRQMTLSDLAAAINADRQHGNSFAFVSSALYLFRAAIAIGPTSFDMALLAIVGTARAVLSLAAGTVAFTFAFFAIGKPPLADLS